MFFAQQQPKKGFCATLLATIRGPLNVYGAANSVLLKPHCYAARRQGPIAYLWAAVASLFIRAAALGASVRPAGQPAGARGDYY